MFVRAIRGLPGIIPYMPRLPDAKPNKQPFKGVRQGLQLLVIDVDIDVNKYKIEINVPSMAFDFINPLFIDPHELRKISINNIISKVPGCTF